MKILLLWLLPIFALTACSKKKPEYQELIDRAKAAPAIRDIRDDKLLPGEDSVIAGCEEILDRLHRSGVRSAFEKVRALSPLSTEELDKLEQMTEAQLGAIEPRFGKIIGFERVRVTRKSESVMECVYLAKCERHILRWRFYFYRPQEKWFLNSLMWDDDIKGL